MISIFAAHVIERRRKPGIKLEKFCQLNEIRKKGKATGGKTTR